MQNLHSQRHSQDGSTRQSGIGFAHVLGGTALIGGLVAVATTWPDSAAPSAELRQHMSGSFVIAEPASDVELRLGQAVERVVATMGPSVRGVARAQLSRVVDYCRAYRLDVGVDSVRVSCDPTVTTEVAGGTGAVLLGSEAVGLHAEFDEDALVVSSSTQSGSERTTYRVNASGGLEVAVRMTSEQLDRPLAWTVRYRRVEDTDPMLPPAVAASLAER